MSLLNYLSRKRGNNLPDPRGTLSNSEQLLEVEAEMERIRKADKKRGPYKRY